MNGKCGHQEINEVCLPNNPNQYHQEERLEGCDTSAQTNNHIEILVCTKRDSQTNKWEFPIHRAFKVTNRHRSEEDAWLNGGSRS